MYLKNPYDCVVVNDFEEYDVKSESLDMANLSVLGTKAQYVENNKHIL